MEYCKLNFFLLYYLWLYFNLFHRVIIRFFWNIDNFFFYFSLCLNLLLWNLFYGSWHRLHLYLLLLYLLSTRSTFSLRSIFCFLDWLNLFCACSVRLEYFLSACSHNSLCYFTSNFIFVSRGNVSRGKILNRLFISVDCWQRRFFLRYNLRQFGLKFEFCVIFLILNISLPCLN